jgi:protein-tyrosine-phosphatase
MSTQQISVLFVCHGNGPRSVMAAELLNNRFGTFYRGYSADIHPPSSHYEHDDRLVQIMAQDVQLKQGRRRDVKTIKNFSEPVDIVVCMWPISSEVVVNCNPQLRKAIWLWWEIPEPRDSMMEYQEVREKILERFVDLSKIRIER